MLLEFLNENSGVFSVVFSAVVSIATVVYAILTWKLVSEARKMRETYTEPKVSVVVQPREEWIYFIDMIIQNVGLGPAYKIHFNITPNFEYAPEKFLSELGFVKSGLSYLAPSQKLRFFLTSMLENFEEKISKPFEVRITYQNTIGKKYKDVYKIDFSQFVGLSKLGEPALYKIAKNIEEIKRDINHLSTGFIKVIRY